VAFQTLINIGGHFGGQAPRTVENYLELAETAAASRPEPVNTLQYLANAGGHVRFTGHNAFQLLSCCTATLPAKFFDSPQSATLFKQNNRCPTTI